MLRELAAERAAYLVDMCQYDERRNEQSCKPVKPTALQVEREAYAEEARDMARKHWFESTLFVIMRDAVTSKARRMR